MVVHVIPGSRAVTAVRIVAICVTALLASCCSTPSPPELACTDLGAAVSVEVQVAPTLLPRAFAIVASVCVRDECNDVGGAGSPIQLSQDVVMSNIGSLGHQDEAELRVKVIDKTSRLIASSTQPVGFVAEYPNGKACGPALVVDATSVIVSRS